MIDPSLPNFPLLPTEIRLNIWQCANLRRTIFLRVYEDLSRQYPCFSIKDATVPTLLAVCRESRYETLKTYTMVQIYDKPRFYLNPALDTLYFFPRPWFNERLSISKTRLARNTAFPPALTAHLAC